MTAMALPHRTQRSAFLLTLLAAAQGVSEPATGQSGPSAARTAMVPPAHAARGQLSVVVDPMAALIGGIRSPARWRGGSGGLDTSLGVPGTARTV